MCKVSRKALGRRLVPLFCICGALLAVAGCGSSSNSPSGTATSNAGSNGSGGGSTSPVIIGIATPYSGSSGSYGQYNDEVFKLALQQYGAKVGNRPIQFVKGDTQCTPSVAVQAIHQVLAKQPAVVMASGCSGDTLAMKPLLTAHHIPAVSINLAPGIVTGDPYMWDVAPTMQQINAPFAKYIQSQTHATSVAILHDTTAYGEACDKGMVDGLKAIGVKVGVDASYSFDDTDFSGQILSAKKAGVQAVYIEGYSEQLGEVVKQARSLGLNVPIYAPQDADDSAAFKAGGDALNGVVFAEGYVQNSSPASQKFTSQWKAAFPKLEPGANIENFYEAAVVLVKALHQVGPDNINAGAIKKAIAGLKLEVPSGTLQFAATGERLNPPVYIGKVNNNAVSEIKQLAQ
ncbi:MAG: ABC transporter substrate-binding protein [Solirubrobacteraceae bacterium]